LSSTLQPNFSHSFPGKIWSLHTAPENDLLFIEIRDEVNFQVTFAALQIKTNQFLWNGLGLKESWWVSLQSAKEHTVLFQSYASKGNPDHKNLIAFDIFSKSVRWEVEEFSFYDWNDTTIFGYRTKDEIQPAIIDPLTGVVTAMRWEVQSTNRDTKSTNTVQFLEGTTHFESIKSFIGQKTQLSIVMGVEYLDWDNWIMVSAYAEQEGSLANYLLVFDKAGNLLLREILGEKLQGLGTDTFFVLSGCLFFVKNKSELVAYTLYD